MSAFVFEYCKLITSFDGRKLNERVATCTALL